MEEELQELLKTPEERLAGAEARLAWHRARESREAERRALEEARAERHPTEWREWLRVRHLGGGEIEFGSCEVYDFQAFLAEVGPAPSHRHALRPRDEARPIGRDNLEWADPSAAGRGPSPYYTLEEAAAYCRMKPKTLLNHHSLGNVASYSQRPLLFTKEALDAFLASDRRRTERKKRKKAKK